MPLIKKKWGLVLSHLLILPRGRGKAKKGVPHIINFKYPILFYFQNEMVWNSVMSNRNTEPRSNYIFKGAKWEQIKGPAQVSTQTNRPGHSLTAFKCTPAVMSEIISHKPQVISLKNHFWVTIKIRFLKSPYNISNSASPMWSVSKLQP